MKKVMLFVAAMVIVDASALGKTAHRKAYSTPNYEVQIGGSANSSSVGGARKPVGINVVMEKKKPEAKADGENKGEAKQPVVAATAAPGKEPVAKQPDERLPEAISGTNGEISSGDGVAKDPARKQALRYTDQDKLDSGSRLKCFDQPDGSVSITTKTGKSFIAPVVDGTADLQRASHMETNGVTFLKANGFASPADAVRNGVSTVEPPGGIDFVRDLAPKNRAAYRYYYPTTLADQQAMKEGRSFTIKKLVIRKLGNNECDALAGGGDGDDAKAPSTNNGGQG